jgi:hypothetical protein
LSNKRRSISHYQHTVSVFLPVEPLALILEKRVCISICSCSRSQFCCWVNATLVATLKFNIFCVVFFLWRVAVILNIKRRFIKRLKLLHLNVNF